MRITHLIVASAVAVSFACAKQVPTKVAKAEPQPPAAQQQEKQPEAPTASMVPSLKDPVAELQTLLQSSKIHFGLDDSTLDEESRKTLQQVAEVLRKTDPSVVIEISGHADERGTEEYNLALGHRRAQAAKAYLTALGVGADRVQIISYGDQRPAVEGHDEIAWRANRRDEIRVAESKER